MDEEIKPEPLSIRLTNSFKKDYKTAEKRNYDLSVLDEVVNKLASHEALDAKYCDHALIGKKYKGMRECHLKPNWLLVYRIIESELILELLYTGTHSDLF